jgi:hypothetical protein
MTAHPDVLVPSGWRDPVPDVAAFRGLDADGVAGEIAARLVRGAGPVTAVLGTLLRAQVRLRVTGPHVRPAYPDEAADLRVAPGTDLYVREGWLMAGTILAAKTMLKLPPERILERAGPAAWARIRGGEPLGAVLGGGRQRFRRARRTVTVVPGGNPAVTSAALVLLGALPAALAAEDIPEALCQRLADAARAG